MSNLHTKFPLACSSGWHDGISCPHSARGGHRASALASAGMAAALWAVALAGLAQGYGGAAVRFDGIDDLVVAKVCALPLQMVIRVF